MEVLHNHGIVDPRFALFSGADGIVDVSEESEVIPLLLVVDVRLPFAASLIQVHAGMTGGVSCAGCLGCHNGGKAGAIHEILAERGAVLTGLGIETATAMYSA